MKKLIVYSILAAFSVMIPTSLTAAVFSKAKQLAMPVGPSIKILLEKDQNAAFLEAKGAYRVIRKDNGASLSSGKAGKRFVVHALQDGLRWGEEYPDIYQIAIIPLSPHTSFLVNGIQYKGSISIYHMRNNHIAIVNEIPLEEYVKSTLAITADGTLSQEALAALAIVVRTEGYHSILQAQQLVRPWDILATEAGYHGAGVAHKSDLIDSVVDWTRFMVLKSPHEELITLSSNQAEELAQKGLNAQKILKSAFPQAKMGTTVDPDELSIR